MQFVIILILFDTTDYRCYMVIVRSRIGDMGRIFYFVWLFFSSARYFFSGAGLFFSSARFFFSSARFFFECKIFFLSARFFFECKIFF